MPDIEDQKKNQALTYLNHVTKDPDLIEIATGWRRTFSFHSENLVTPSKMTTSDISRFLEPEMIEQIKRAWDELLELSVAEIEQEIENWKQKEWQEEQDNYLFNQPDARFIDLEFWARSATWTNEEAVMLSLNRHPLPLYLDSIKNLTDSQIQESEIAKNFFDRLALAMSAQEAGQVSSVGKSMDFVEWFIQMEFETRPDLIERVTHYQSNEPKPEISREDELRDREKTTLLRLVAAMAVRGYSYDPAKKRNDATSDIKSDLELLGLQLDDKTILKWLRSATELIDKDYWREN